MTHHLPASLQPQLPPTPALEAGLCGREPLQSFELIAWLIVSFPASGYQREGCPENSPRQEMGPVPGEAKGRPEPAL